jgi:hypothetical protein
MTSYIRRSASPARHLKQSVLGEIFTINNTPMECTRVREAILAGAHVSCIEFQSVKQQAFAFAGQGPNSEAANPWSDASSDSLEADGWRPADPAAAIAFLHGK